MMRILEWNINNRLGHAKVPMPNWVVEEIRNKEADISILVESSRLVSNLNPLLCSNFNKDKYQLIQSNNYRYYQNDVSIIINKELVEVVQPKAYVSRLGKYPDHLMVECIDKRTNTPFTVAGIRIHADANDQAREKEFAAILNELDPYDNVIIAGDLNCNKRVCHANWNLNRIDDLSAQHHFKRYTPEGASWARDVDTRDNFCFALDHFFVKGKIGLTLESYDRSFTVCDPDIYKWGTDFCTEFGFENPQNSIPDPYPDHAILIGECFF